MGDHQIMEDRGLAPNKGITECRYRPIYKLSFDIWMNDYSRQRSPHKSKLTPTLYVPNLSHSQSDFRVAYGPTSQNEITLWAWPSEILTLVLVPEIVPPYVYVISVFCIGYSCFGAHVVKQIIMSDSAQ